MIVLGLLADDFVHSKFDISGCGKSKHHQFSPDAQKEESHLVKLALPWIPMLDDYAWSDPLSMTK